MPRGVYKHKKGKESGRWKGGRYLDSNGYWIILKPDHPRAHINGYVLEHIIIAEKMLNRPLRKGEEIHHMGKKDDNTRIKVCKNRAEHKQLHARLQAVRTYALPGYRVNQHRCKIRDGKPCTDILKWFNQIMRDLTWKL